MFLRNDSPLHLSSHGRKPHPLAYSAYTPSTLKDSSPSLKMRADKNHSPDYVLAAFFLSLVAFLSFWSQQKERNEQNSFLHKDISLTLNMTPRHPANCLALRQRRNGTNSPRQPRSSRKLTPRASQCSQTLCTFLRTYSFSIELRKSAINLRATASSFHGFSSSRLKSSFTG